MDEINMKIGIGYDLHALVEGRPLILGGVTIPFDRGLKGHSDGDALLHAISDALLGACAMGDIGQHFPDTDPKFKGADSAKLLGEVGAMLGKKGMRPTNIDANIIDQLKYPHWTCEQILTYFIHHIDPPYEREFFC